MNSDSSYSSEEIFGPELVNILNALHSGHVEQFRQAIEYLRKLNPIQKEKAIGILVPVLQHEDPEKRCDAAELLLLIDSKETISKVLPLSKDPIDFVRNCILQEIEFNGYYNSDLVKVLIDMVSLDTNSDVRYRAATILGKIGDPTAEPILRWVELNDKGINYEGDTVSARAKWALGEIRNSDNGQL
jgi:HEAT repeat protein